jgi:OB-fold nucleic acid binding domain
VTSSRRVVTKAGGQLLIAKLEDQTGTIELVVFPKWYPQLSPSFTDDAIVVVKARVKERRQGPQGRPVVVPTDAGESAEEERPEISLQVVEVWPFASAPVLGARPAPVAAPKLVIDPGAATLNVRLCGDAQDAHRLGRLRDLVSSAGGGSGKIVLHAGANGDTRPLKQSVAITDAMRAELAGLFGGDNVWQAEER